MAFLCVFLCRPGSRSCGYFHAKTRGTRRTAKSDRSKAALARGARWRQNPPRRCQHPRSFFLSRGHGHLPSRKPVGGFVSLIYLVRPNMELFFGRSPHLVNGRAMPKCLIALDRAFNEKALLTGEAEYQIVTVCDVSWRIVLGAVRDRATPGTPRACCESRGSLLMGSLGLAGRHGPHARLALVRLCRSRRSSRDWRTGVSPHHTMAYGDV